MTDATPAGTVTLTTTTGQLATILGATLPFAAASWDHPGLAGVRIHAGGGVISATATNRFVLGHARKPGTGELPRAVYLHKDTARQIRKALSRSIKNRRSGDDAVSLMVDFGAGRARVTVEFSDITMRTIEGRTGEHAPDLTEVLAKLPSPDALALDAPVNLAPIVLKPLLKAARWSESGRQAPLRWSFNGAQAPARAEIEDWFVAVVMPVKAKASAPVPTAFPGPAPAAAPTATAEPVLQPASQG